MTALLRTVKSRLAIHSRRAVRGILDGEYSSVFHGRSTEFDDVRQYVPGDEVRDLDWKATARIGAPMTRRYIAARKHTVLLVVPTGREFAASAPSGEPKIDLAVYACGVLGYLATNHGDLVGVAASEGDRMHVLPPGGSEAHLERILGLLVTRSSLGSPPGDLAALLSAVTSRYRRRMILVVVADDRALADTYLAVLRRLAAQHDILWITIGDADPTRAEWADAAMVDVSTEEPVPAYLRADPALRAAFASATASSEGATRALLDGVGISRTRVEGIDEVVPRLFSLLERHRRARR